MKGNGQIIKIDGVSRSFGGTQALNDVSFSIDKGEIHALVGENGAGKSTLMKIIAGVQTNDSGKIIIKDEEITYADPLEARKMGVSMVFQELNLFPQLTVYENIFITKEVKSKIGVLNKRKMTRDSRDILKSLAADHEIPAYAAIESLPVADQQLVEISRAISYGTDILILDEPNSALSESESQALFKIIRGLRDKGITIIYVSHRLEEVFQIADRITVMRDGKYIDTLKVDETSVEEVIAAMVGKRIDEMFPPLRDIPKDAKLILEVKGLNKTDVLNNINFELHEGEVLGFAGLEGCGIVDIFRILFGLEKKNSGEIIYSGESYDKITPWASKKMGWSLIPAERHRQGLMTDWNIRDNLNIAIIEKLLSKIGLISYGKSNVAANESVKKLNIITDSILKKVLDLSGGNQQKVVIAKWLATNPKLLILNDPTRGIDVGAKAEVYRLIDELARQGFAIIFTSSEFEEVLELSDNI
ncbi:sugar ABC transporter ATP-binding protein, partial [Actinomycetota bacterium]